MKRCWPLILLLGVLCSITPGSAQQPMFPPGPLDNPIRIIDKSVQQEIFSTLSEGDKNYLLHYDNLYRGTYLWYVGNGLCVYTTALIRPPVGEYEVINPGRFPCTPTLKTTTTAQTGGIGGSGTSAGGAAGPGPGGSSASVPSSGGSSGSGSASGGSGTPSAGDPGKPIGTETAARPKGGASGSGAPPRGAHGDPIGPGKQVS